MLEVYSEAVVEYQLILDSDPDYIPALKGKNQKKSYLPKYIIICTICEWFTTYFLCYKTLMIQLL